MKPTTMTESSVQIDARLIERVRIANQDMSDDFEPALKVLATRLSTVTAALREADEALLNCTSRYQHAWSEQSIAAIEKARQRLDGKE